MKLKLTLFLCLCICGCTEFNPVTRKQDIILYSTGREVKIGRNISRQVEKEYEVVKNPNIVDRINKIADRIIAVADRRDIAYFVRVIEAKDEEKKVGADINAFALPGGYIYLYDGLVEFVDNDDQLACIIAHEVAHIVAKHSIKKLQASMGYALLTIASIESGDANFAIGVQHAFLNMLLAYSRQDEFLADKVGIRYAKKAGYNPRAMIDFLEKLHQKKRDEPLRARSIYRTHPYFSERIVEIKKALGEPLSIADFVNMSNE